MVTPTNAASVDENPFGKPTTRAFLDAVEAPRVEFGGVGFWDVTPQLQRIAAEAQGKRVSPWGALVGCMAHRASHVPPNVVLVDAEGNSGTDLGEGTSVNGFFGLVAPPGGGKSVTFKLASKLIPPNGYAIPDGTGQGIVKMLAETKTVTKDDEGKTLDEPYQVIRFHRHHLVIHAPEVKTLNAEFSREGSKTADMMRSIWAGETVGMTNADKERNAAVPPNMSRVCGVWGVQPQNATAILAQAEDGTPQRFVWAPAKEYRSGINRTPPPPGTDFPFPIFGTHPLGVVLPKELRFDTALPTPIWVRWSPLMKQNITEFYAEQNQSDDRDPYADISEEKALSEEKLTMKAHLMLTRIKIAVWVGWIHGRPEPSDLDWVLSGFILAVSVSEMAGIWKRCQEAVLKEATGKGKTRAFELNATDTAKLTLKDAAVVKTADAIFKKLLEGPLRERDVRQRCSTDQKLHAKDALRHLEDEGRAEHDGTHWWAAHKGYRIGEN